MIKNIFLPERIGNYYLFPKRILGVDLAKTHVNITQVLAQGNSLSVEKHIEEQLQPGTPANHTERTVAALKKARAQFKYADEVRTIIPSALTFFKQLKLPFVSREKIAMVIEFEVEPLLPFSLRDAVLDFIIINQDDKEKSSQVLVAAVQKQHITHHLELFAQAGMNPAIITVDLFALYDVFSHITKYQSLSGSTALIDLGLQSTHIAYINAGKLKFIRTVTHGLSHIAKQVSEKLNIPPNQAMENIIRFGTKKDDNPEYVQATTQALDGFWHKIRFTLDSFDQQTVGNNSLKHIIVLGDGATIKSLVESAQLALKVPTESFDSTLIASHDRIAIAKNIIIPSTGIISTCAALPLPLMENFNLRRNEFISADSAGIMQQLIVAAILVVGIFGSLLGYTIIQGRLLNSEFNESQREVVETLKKRFKGVDEDEQDWQEVLEEAEKELRKEQDTLFKFSQRGRASFLQTLFELTSRIDQEGLGFQIDRMNINDNELIIKAHVRDHDALKVLERELRQSNVFSYVQPQDDPDFTMRITLARSMEDL